MVCETFLYLGNLIEMTGTPSKVTYTTALNFYQKVGIKQIVSHNLNC